MWLKFSSKFHYPFAVKIAAGKVNAVTGETWSNGLIKRPQDYVVVPNQPWLDGFCVQKGLVRQFVATPANEKTHPVDIDLFGAEAIVHVPKALAQLVQRAEGLQRKVAEFHGMFMAVYLSRIYGE